MGGVTIPTLVLTVTEARKLLPALIDSGELTFLGDRRRPEAVIMGLSEYQRGVCPDPVLNTLIAGCAARTADQIIRDPSPSGRGHTIHIGDPAGRVLGWLWTSGQPRRAVQFLADLIAELRNHHPERIEPRPRLIDVLNGLRFAMPNDFPESELTALITRAASEVPLYYGSNPDDL